jgi:hypothetical protein
VVLLCRVGCGRMGWRLMLFEGVAVAGLVTMMRTKGRIGG